jgi:NAD(P)-dependent dehydrogenase (short-subunit alcohol dehydrogenase family)
MWDTTLAVNLTGTFLMSQQVGRAMLEAGGGKIINIASQAASIGLDQHAAYCASKAGVRGPAPGGRGASRWVLPDGQRGLSAAAPGARRPHRGHRRLAACPEIWPAVPPASGAARGCRPDASLPGLAPSRIRRWCAHRVPVDARDRVRAGCDTRPGT